MTPEYDTRNRFLSSFVNLPIKFAWQKLLNLGDKDRLLTAMAMSKGYYDYYLGNPCTIQLMAQLMQLAPPRGTWPYKQHPPMMVTNLGIVDNILPPVWPNGSARAEAPLIEIDHLRLQHRWTQRAP